MAEEVKVQNEQESVKPTVKEVPVQETKKEPKRATTTTTTTYNNKLTYDDYDIDRLSAQIDKHAALLKRAVLVGNS